MLDEGTREDGSDEFEGRFRKTCDDRASESLSGPPTGVGRSGSAQETQRMYQDLRGIGRDHTALAVGSDLLVR